jgi:helicase
MIQYKGEYIYATDFGRRVSELYIDPLSAVLLRDGLRKGAPNVTDFTWLHLVCHTPNMRPIMRPRRNEAGAIEDYVEEHRDEFACSIPEYDNYIDYEQFLGEVKTAVVLKGWIDEMSESDLLERFSVQPGDRYNAVHNAEWLLYSSHQLAGVLELPDHRRQLKQLRDRVKYGVTKQLLPLVNIRSIGRVRARILYKSGFTTISSLKKAPVNKLIEIPLIGVRIAKLIKEQVGGIISEEEWRKLETEDKKQRALTDFTEEDPNLVER